MSTDDRLRKNESGTVLLFRNFHRNFKFYSRKLFNILFDGFTLRRTRPIQRSGLQSDDRIYYRWGSTLFPVKFHHFACFSWKAFQIFSKVVVMLMKAPKIRTLIDELNNYFCDEFVVKQRDSDVIEKCFEYDKKLAVFFCVFSLLVTFVNTVKPLIETLAKR